MTDSPNSMTGISNASGSRYIVIEDDFVIAGDIRDALQHAGIRSVETYSSNDDVVGRLSSDIEVAAAFVGLSSKQVLHSPIVARLEERGARIVFTNGPLPAAEPPGWFVMERPFTHQDLDIVLTELSDGHSGRR